MTTDHQVMWDAAQHIWGDRVAQVMQPPFGFTHDVWHAIDAHGTLIGAIVTYKDLPTAPGGDH